MNEQGQSGGTDGDEFEKRELFGIAVGVGVIAGFLLMASVLTNAAKEPTKRATMMTTAGMPESSISFVAARAPIR